ncbi:hypothetical protein [Rhodopirellula bahusiensis]|uniref:hypothetical protein n=1 Tax=Rhodopirellula bahusiensis TaxID=2014065 RepID=UPI0032638C19
MSVRVGTFEFDLMTGGPFVVPKWRTRAFVQPGTQHAGAHMQPPAGELFTRQFTRHDGSEYFQVNQDRQLAQIGFARAVYHVGVDYAFTHRILFFVADVRVITAEIIPHASGSRFGSAYNHSPASRVITEWDMIAVPR